MNRRAFLEGASRLVAMLGLGKAVPSKAMAEYELLPSWHTDGWDDLPRADVGSILVATEADIRWVQPEEMDPGETPVTFEQLPYVLSCDDATWEAFAKAATLEAEVRADVADAIMANLDAEMLRS